jgi:zinc transport system ATP-binding protein
MNILEVKDLSVALEGKTILNKVSFDLEAGESLAIIGPNGSGKTVLLKSILGLFPFSGEIAKKFSGTVGYVPQKVDADIHLPLTFQNLFQAKAKNSGLAQKNIDECIKTVGLPHEVVNTPVGHLSGGQFQRCLIAFAILGKPSLLLFDEPTASIDNVGEEQMYELIHRLSDRFELTTIIVSHDLSFVYRYATKVLCLNKQNICFGNPQEVLNPEVLAKLYGGPTRYYHHLHQ